MRTGSNGGFQNFMRAPAHFAYKIPAGLDSVSAAPLLCAGVTVYAPLRRLITHPGICGGVRGGGAAEAGCYCCRVLGLRVTYVSRAQFG